MGRGVNSLAGRRLIKSGSGYFTYTAVPTGTTTDHRLYLNMNVPLGGDNQTDRYNISHFDSRDDPVDTGIVGIAIGTGHTFLDKDWGVEDDLYAKISMGLYLTPHLSARLAYARGDLRERSSGDFVVYENYSLDGQYYFNIQQKLRPFVTAGFGEQMWDEDLERKTFQWNAGLGLHWRLHRKWALQTDWIHYYSPSRKTYDHNVNAGLVYRFGRGEHDDW
jgi:hypothetical protein